MTHAWSSDPARDARVRLEEDGLSSPRPTLEEAIKAVNAARQEGTAEYFRRISRLMCERMQKQQWDKAMHPLDAASKANAAARERDRANEARARYRKRWQERGKTIAKLQARLSERQSGAVNASLRKWCRVVEDQRDVLKLQREEATSEAASLKKLVSTYGDRIAELHKANKQLDEGYNAAVLAVAEATNKRLEAEGERDAAIRERDEMRKSWLRSEESGTRLLAECNAALDAADGLRKQVAELKDKSHARCVSMNKFLCELAETRFERDKSVARAAEDARAYAAESDARAQSQQELQDCCDTEFVPAESAGSGAAERLHRETWLRRERDELIIQRDEIISRVAELEAQAKSLREDAAASARLMYSANSDCIDAQAERDTLQARVAELEAASGGGEKKPMRMPSREWFARMVDVDEANISVGGLASRVAEVEAANGGEQEPDAWGIVRDGNVDSVTHRLFRNEAGDIAEKLGGTVVPLYRSPPQPRGWLTEEEREAVEASREFWQVECDSTLGDDTDRRYLAALSNLLARSTPPEVVLDAFPTDETGESFSRRDVLAALAAAGVAVKEVQ